MPGSPYLDEPPKGLWTWPRLLKLALPPLLLSCYIAFEEGFLVEYLAFILIALTFIGLRRR